VADRSETIKLAVMGAVPFAIGAVLAIIDHARADYFLFILVAIAFGISLFLSRSERDGLGAIANHLMLYAAGLAAGGYAVTWILLQLTSGG
jgi:hypothetical protein